MKTKENLGHITVECVTIKCEMNFFCKCKWYFKPFILLLFMKQVISSNTRMAESCTKYEDFHTP